MMDIARYLDRLDVVGVMTPDLHTLRALHRAHMLAVPFENLNILLKRPIVLDEQALYHKVVNSRRGGFCYELNGLFAALLREIGFQVDLLSARVWMGEDFSQEFDHLTLVVHLKGGDWVADVGFGDCFIEPLRLTADLEQTVSNGTFRLVRRDDRWLLQVLKEGEWQNEYLFSTTPYALKDFEQMCEYQQTSSESGFNKRRICSRAMAEGRITIRDQKLIITNQGQREEVILANEVAVTTALKEYFAIDLNLR